MNAPKIAVLVAWFLLAACFLLPTDSWLSTLGRAGFVLMVVAHVVEFFVFLPVLRKVPSPLAAHLAGMLVFGVVYYQEVREIADSAGEGH